MRQLYGFEKDSGQFRPARDRVPASEVERSSKGYAGAGPIQPEASDQRRGGARPAFEGPQHFTIFGDMRNTDLI